MRIALILPLLLLSAACTAEGPGESSTASAAALTLPTREEATNLVANSPEFSDYHFTYSSFSLPMNRNMMNEPTLKNAEELKEGGWLTFDSDGSVILSDKAYKDKRFIQRPNGFTDVVPLARREFGEVADIEAAPEGKAYVEFTWKWIPNEVGQSLRSGLTKERFEKPQRARATLYDVGSGKWGVLIVEPVELP